MKIGIQTYGSRGDINPFIALAQGLSEQGHSVDLYYTCYNGDDFTRYATDKLKVISTRTLIPDNQSYNKVPFRKIYLMNSYEQIEYINQEVFSLFFDEMEIASELLCKESDIVIANPTDYHMSCVAEKNNVPRICLHQGLIYGNISDNSKYLDDLLNNMLLDEINLYRKKLELKPVANVRWEIYNSQQMNLVNLGKEFQNRFPYKEDKFDVCGVFKLDNNEGYSLTNEIQEFLSQGAPPVFFSMGSLLHFEEDKNKLIELFIEAIELSKCRAIIQANWENITYSMPENSDIFKISYIPHHLIFPKCSAVVHHGGEGTTHTAILAGTPSIVIAYAWDQFYWSEEIKHAGAGTDLIKRKTIDAYQLAGDIRKIILNDEFERNTNNCRVKMKRENGVKKAIKLIHEHL